MKRVGVVVPTLFNRGDYLEQCLNAIRSAGDAYVILMGPDVKENSKGYVGLFDGLLEEPPTGSLSAKLAVALNSFPLSVDLLTWIGDDDLLEPGSLAFLEQQFSDNSELCLIFGACRYVDQQGNKIGENKSGSWALRLASVGPFLAPQPGSLFTRDAYISSGGLDPSLKLAFDFDLFLSLQKHGETKYVNRTLASFRWHNGSLSVQDRSKSVKEASIVRLKHATPWKKPFVLLINPLVEVATLFAAKLLPRVAETDP